VGVCLLSAAVCFFPLYGAYAMTFTSPRDKVLQDLDAAKLGMLLAAEKISQSEYDTHCPQDEEADLLAAIADLPSDGEQHRAVEANRERMRLAWEAEQAAEDEAHRAAERAVKAALDANAKAAKAKLRKGHPCVEIEECETYKGTRMFKLFFVDADGKKQQCCKLGEVKLGTIASAVNAGMFKTAKIHIPKG
jgi:hypothetical protein